MAWMESQIWIGLRLGILEEWLDHLLGWDCDEKNRCECVVLSQLFQLWLLNLQLELLALNYNLLLLLLRRFSRAAWSVVKSRVDLLVRICEDLDGLFCDFRSSL